MFMTGYFNSYFVGDTNTLFSIMGFFLSDSFSLMTQLQEQALISLAISANYVEMISPNNYNKKQTRVPGLNHKISKQIKHLSTECKTH